MFSSTSSQSQQQELEQLLDECVSKIRFNSGKKEFCPMTSKIKAIYFAHF